MSKKWTKKEEATLLNMVNEGYTTEEIAKKLDRSYKSISHRRADLTRNMLKKNNLISEESKEYKVADVGKTIIQKLQEELTHTPNIIEKTILPTHSRKVGDTLMIHFTDWHVGRIVKDELGNELYNTEIFKTRIQRLLSEIIALLDGYIRKGTPIKDVVIMSTGDILDGMGIFASQETLSEMSPPFQVMLAVDVIKDFILALIERKLTISFYGVRGNHGEIRGDKGKPKDLNANWDMMLYLILDFWSKNVLKNKNVMINYSELDYLNFEVQGWKYHIRHIAPQQSETSAGKGKFLGWARKHNFDALVYGHYHHWGIWDRSGITVFRGGSIPGADEYSEQLAEESEPIQLIWGCSKNRPMTFAYAIDLGKRE